MTVDDVTRAVEAIRVAADDDERAHGLEDDLRKRVLQAIADGTPNAQALAIEALTTGTIFFARWCG